MVKIIKEHKAFALIFALAAVIRFLPAFSYQFSYDELCGLRNSIYPDWRQMIDYGVKLDTHPVLVQLIINATVNVFGYSEFWVKLPFLLFSLAAIFYAYVFSLKWFGKTPALIASVIFSFSYIFLFYAPLARMYSGGLFFSTALMYYLFEICFNEEKDFKRYMLFVVFIVLCALNNHLSALFAFTAAFVGLFFQNKKSAVYYLIACLSAVLIYLPHLSITIWQFSQGGIGHGQDGWLAAPDKGVLFTFLKTLLGTGYVWTAFVLLFVVSVFKDKAMVISKKQTALIVLFLVNYAIIHAYSVLKAPIFQNSVMLFSAPCFVWFLTSYFNFTKSLGALLAFVVSVIVLFQSLYVKDFFNNAVLNQNGYQSEQYVILEDKYGKGKVESYYMGSQRYFVIEHELKYKRKFNYHIGEDFNDIYSFIKTVSSSKAQFVLLGEPDYIQLEIVKNYFPHLLAFKQTLNVNYYLFSKTATENKIKHEEATNVSGLTYPNGFEYNYDKSKLQQIYGVNTYSVDSLNEFCLSEKAELSKLNLKEGNVLLAKLTIDSKDSLGNVGLHGSIESGKDSTLYFGGVDAGQFYKKDSSLTFVVTQIYIGSEFKYWIKQDGKINFFVWNRAKKKFNVLNLEVTIINHWPQRWSWWD